eukprot:8669293-Pyramimonas_sp.AAC.2
MGNDQLGLLYERRLMRGPLVALQHIIAMSTTYFDDLFLSGGGATGAELPGSGLGPGGTRGPMRPI